jgi:competence protein ComEA
MKKIGLVLVMTAALLAQVSFIHAEAPAAKKKTEAPALTDINSASEAELQKLKGIGPAISKKIVQGRPYKGKDDLVKKKILSKSVYEGIKSKIVAKQ